MISLYQYQFLEYDLKTIFALIAIWLFVVFLGIFTILEASKYDEHDDIDFEKILKEIEYEIMKHEKEKSKKP